MAGKEKKNEDAEFYADTMEQDHKETEHRADFLNRQQSVFQSVYDKGLNRQKSVFDNTAIFRTTEK